MVLRTGTAVGPYEIVAPIGAGGMGEVYRARDPRIGRDVALKVLPGAATGEPERLRRFEQEARSAGALNHPNVLAVYDVGSHDGVPYIVSELLAGETLRSRIGGTPLPMRKALDYAVQIAHGLAGAHEKGIVHRDLKPENLFVTRDGRVKILDFGLAKLGPESPAIYEAQGSALSSAETATGTLPGALLGTLGYMSPEQAQGLAADARSDIFSFGAVLYEMLTGRRAFKAATAPETLTAILKRDPLEAVGVEVQVSPGLERVLRHCLEKSPEERFQSARDLAFALEALSGASDPAYPRAALAASAGRKTRLAAAVGGALIVATALGAVAAKSWWTAPPPRFKALTFRAGTVLSARFSPDGQTIAYSAAWDGGPLELYTQNTGQRESRAFGLQHARVLSISRSGEVAVQLLAADTLLGIYPSPPGTLAKVPLAGGTPRKMFEQTESADWSPDGSELAVSRWVKGKCRVEYPVGQVLYESEQRIPIVRVSPKGNRVAFLEEVWMAGRLFNTRWLSVVDRAGKKQALYEGWGTTGIAWSKSGQEIYLDTFEDVGARGIRAVSIAGKSRLVSQLGGSEGMLVDLSSDGQALFIVSHARHVIFAQAPGEKHERNLSWRNESTVIDLSRDGRTLLFNEIFSGGGRTFGTSIRSTDGSPAVRLGEGYSLALSPDGRWALGFGREGASLVFDLLPTGAGERKRIAQGLPVELLGASWLPDSRSFVFAGGTAGGNGGRLYLQDLEGGPPRPLTEEGAELSGPVVSPDGLTVAASDADGIVLATLLGGELRRMPGVEDGEMPIQWKADGRALFLYRPSRPPVAIDEVDVVSGRRRRFREITLPDATGVYSNVVVVLTPDARAYAYSFYRNLNELHLVEGLD
jgi:Tol biopolymer transport system component